MGRCEDMFITNQQQFVTVFHDKEPSVVELFHFNFNCIYLEPVLSKELLWI